MTVELANRPEYPAGEDGVLDLGHRHFVRMAGQRCWLWWHDCPAVEHVSWWWFGDHDDGRASGHSIVSREPLSVGGSLLCTLCGDHGFISEGRWMPA